MRDVSLFVSPKHLDPECRPVCHASPRACSPLAILEDAKAFLANPAAAETPPRRPATQSRKPSLDANKLPFGGGSYEELSTGQRRLPSLTVEEFQAIRRRDGVESRCSDPGAHRASRGSSHSHTRRKHRHHEGTSGTSSAPASRGTQGSDPDTPVHFPEAPMTDPAEHRRHGRSLANASCSPLLRHASSPAPLNAMHEPGGSTPSRSHNFKRPPQAPPSRGALPSRERRPLSRDPESIDSPGAFESPSAYLAWGSPSAKGHRPVRESSLHACGLPAPEPEPEPRRCARALAGSRSAAQLHSMAPAAEGVVSGLRKSSPSSVQKSAPSNISPEEFLPPEHVASSVKSVPSVPSEECSNPANVVSSVISAPSKVAAHHVDDSIVSNIMLPTHDGWDQGEGEQSQHHSPRSRVNCTVGPQGISGLSIAGGGEAEDAIEHTATINLAAANSVRGDKFVWVRGEVLGRGSLGVVFKALDQRTGQMFAVKEVRIDKKLDTDLKLKKALETELSICKELQHPHIVSYLGHDYLDSNLYIYLEYMPGGSVAQVLSQFGPFDENLIRHYARELLEGLEYLHTRQPTVLHRDIKGANILVGLDCKVKLSDFGCSKRTADTFSLSLRGSIPWMAPEVINQSGYGRRSDIWSLGCVIIEMATTKQPWGNFDNPMAAMIKIGMSDCTPPVPDSVSQLCQSFIQQCTRRDRNLRPLASTLLEHEFVHVDRGPG